MKTSDNITQSTIYSVIPDYDPGSYDQISKLKSEHKILKLRKDPETNLPVGRQVQDDIKKIQTL